MSNGCNWKTFMKKIDVNIENVQSGYCGVLPTYSGFGLMLEPRPLTFMLFSKEKHFIDHDFSISPEPT